MNVYEFESYKDYITQLFKLKKPKVNRSKLAEHLNCHPAFISQALGANKTHFTAEHLYKSGKFFQLKEETISYLLLLHQYERASNLELKLHIKQQIKQFRETKQTIKKQIHPTSNVISLEDQATYYSHWAYMTFHIGVSLKRFSTKQSLVNHFNLSIQFCSEVLDFLISKGLVEKNQGKLSIGKTRIHLDKESPMLKMLHQNLRQKAISELTKNNEENLHYSAILTMSKKDILKIKNLILKLIQEKEKIIAPSKDEELIAFNIDYFKM